MTDANTKICHHLLPFLTQLEEQGASIVRTDENAWSNCVLNVCLDADLSFSQAEKLFDLPAEVKLWRNDDPHYEIENGLFCEKCKHGLSWAKPMKSVNEK